MQVEWSSVQAALADEVRSAAKALEAHGQTLGRSLSQVQAYLQQQQAELAAAVQDPQFNDILVARRDAVLAYAAVQAIEAADQVDATANMALVQAIGSALRVGAVVLAGV